MWKFILISVSSNKFLIFFIPKITWPIHWTLIFILKNIYIPRTRKRLILDISLISTFLLEIKLNLIKAIVYKNLYNSCSAGPWGNCPVWPTLLGLSVPGKPRDFTIIQSWLPGMKKKLWQQPKWVELLWFSYEYISLKKKKIYFFSLFLLISTLQYTYLVIISTFIYYLRCKHNFCLHVCFCILIM